MKKLTLLLALVFLDVLYCAQPIPLLKLKAVIECRASNEPFGYETEDRYYRLDVLNQEILKGNEVSRKLSIMYDKQNYTFLENGSSFLHPGYSSEQFVDENMLRSLSSSDVFGVLNEYIVSSKKEETLGILSRMGAPVYAPESHKQVLGTEVVNKAEIENLVLNCEKNIESDKQKKAIYEAMIIIGIIISIVISYFILKFIINKVRNVAKKTGNKLHEYRVQKIAEDEAIRSTVNKAVRENDGELDKLQNLINNAVAKGDTETAKALLVILEKQKQKKEV